MRIAVLTPMPVEFHEALPAFAAVQKRQDSPFPAVVGNVGANEGLLVECGIGKVNAAMAASWALAAYQPDCILCFGCAGSVSPQVRQCDFIVGNAYAYYDVWCGDPNVFGQVQDMPPYYHADARLLAAARQMDVGVPVHEGALISGDQFVDTGHGIETISKLVPQVLAADMESAAIAQVCCRWKVPFLALRVASDEVCPTDAEHKAMFRRFWETKCHAAFAPARNFLSQLPQNLASIAAH